MSKLAVDVRVAAVAMETVLPEAEDPSLLLTRGRTILARERGTRSMLHDLYWFYRHAAGEDIMLPALVDALCYGLIQLSDDAGNALVYEQPSDEDGSVFGVWYKATVVGAPRQGCHVHVKYCADNETAFITLGATFTHFGDDIPAHGQAPRTFPKLNSSSQRPVSAHQPSHHPSLPSASPTFSTRPTSHPSSVNHTKACFNQPTTSTKDVAPTPISVPKPPTKPLDDCTRGGAQRCSSRSLLHGGGTSQRRVGKPCGWRS
ncbi:MAG: hypothetical protein WDW38_002093 [Sanguina aurantia]